MSADIFKKFTSFKPREFSGSEVYNRFQFQIAFAAELVIKLTKEGNNAITFMDYLDDIVVVDRSTDEGAIIFYQVKSKDKGFITLNIILKNEWLEKMIYNQEAFAENSKFVLVTNTGINFNGKYVVDTDMVSLKDVLKSCTPDISNKIFSSMSTNLKKNQDEINLDNFWLIKTDLTVNDFERQIKGELQNFANKINPKLDTQSLEVIYTKLIEELENKQRKVYNPTVIDIDQLLFQKSYSTEAFKQLVDLTYAIQIPKAKDLFDFLKDNNLIKTDKLIEDLKLIRQYEEFSIENIANKKLIYTLAFEKLKEQVDVIESVNNENLIDVLIKVLDEYDKIANTEFYLKYKFYIVSLFLYKFYEGVI